ncbi:hypothetical protein POVCU2_0016710 [Plasmodium ovale curtisi]|uniref:Uncharacterized protein n=1 Tax=Plasmodium ovale curtisi TaxID=864141 RepID=A0A1A8VV69_PLAOA|nr:hypothetical protein POVCU2_0016710 [Plasmodium ovale curtisi]
MGIILLNNAIRKTLIKKEHQCHSKLKVGPLVNFKTSKFHSFKTSKFQNGYEKFVLYDNWQIIKFKMDKILLQNKEENV